MEILIGADPEFFVTKNGQAFSAHNMVAGTKKNPQKVPNGAVQVDGLALEFNIDPAPTSDVFVHNIQSVMATLTSMIPADCRPEITASILFEEAHLKAQPPEALELGCDPDYNAYNGWPNAKPNNLTNMRTAAGHVHIGWTSDQDPMERLHFEKCKQLSIQLDHYLGLASLVLDTDKRRRSMYGQAGAFRPKPYGCEYRVLSNFWLKSPELMKWVFDTTILSVSRLMQNKVCIKMLNGNEYARNAINTGDIGMFTSQSYRNRNVTPIWEEIQESIRHLMPAQGS